MSNETPLAPARPPTFDEVIQTLTAVAKEKGDDWRVKVFRRAGPAAPMESVAVIDGATTDHLANPETWLVPMCGGGPHYVLSAYHQSDPNVLVASVIPPVINIPPRPVDPSVFGRPNWNGPRRLVFALNTVVPAAPPQPTQPAAPLGGFWSGPPGAGGGNGGEPAPRTQPTLPLPAPGASLPEAALLAQIAADRQALADQRHKMEVEAARREAQEQVKRLEQKLADLGEKMARPAAPPAPTLMEQLPTLIAALAPILQNMEQRRAEDRRLAQEIEARREEREERRREEQARERQAMMDRISAQTAESAKASAANTEALGMMARTMVQTIASTQELLAQAAPPPPDEGLAGILKAGLAALGEYMAASKAAQVDAAAQRAAALGAQRRPAAARPLPPRPPAPTSPPPAVPQTGTPPAPAAAAPAPQSQPQAAVAAPAAPAAEPAPVEVDADEEGDDEGVEISQADPKDVLHAVETALRNHEDPNEVANLYLDALTNPGVVAEVNGGGGTLPFFQNRLGGWIDVPENFEYMKTVLFTLQALVEQRSGAAA